MKDIKNYSEEDIYKDAPGLDPDLDWDEGEYWMKIIAKEKLEKAFEKLLAVNSGGSVRNLLITDGKQEFLNEALLTLRELVLQNNINLVEVDEKDDSWLSEIQTRELFNKLNRPRSVLLIKNYATVNYRRGEDNTARNFLRDAIMNRHYGCGNDFVPSDALPNLLFVVAINDLSKMYWKEEEYSLFDVIHEDDDRGLWINMSDSRPISNMHYVMSAVNKLIYMVSEYKNVLCFDAGDAFSRKALGFIRPIRFISPQERTDIIHTYIDNNLPYFNREVVCLILKMCRFTAEERFTIDVDRLRKSFPNIKSIYCTDVFEIVNADERIEIYDPFELGEHIFSVEQSGNCEAADQLTRRLWSFDFKWANFFRKVVLDYRLPREERIKLYPDGNIDSTVLDKLFRIYLLGWYFKDDSQISLNDDPMIRVKKYQNFDKAIALLSVRFQKWSLSEICEKLMMDLFHILHHTPYDYNTFIKLVLETERLFPGTLNEMTKKGFEKREVNRWRALMKAKDKQ
jgi:hypothetical protein